MRILRLITIALAFPSAAVCIAATTQAATGKLVTPTPVTPQRCAVGHDHSAVCITLASQQKALALNRLHQFEAGLSMRTEKNCYVLRAYRFSGNVGSFHPDQKPEISDCQSAATLRQLPAK
jgi:hypothetical protein